jgi:uncharacterized protein YceH (UPF0502 family)
MAQHPWPKLPEDQRWAIELIEERLERTKQTPDELRARARELRESADSTDIKGYRDARLAAADRYESAAAARLARRPAH